jgi:hypothetical protein
MLAVALSPLVALGHCVAEAREDPGHVGLGPLAFWLLSVTGCAVVLVMATSVLGRARAAGLRTPRLPIATLVFAILTPIATFAYVIFNFGDFFRYSMGRQLRRGNASRLPRLAPTRGSGFPQAAIDAWRENARTEIASVAAFNHLANDLLSLGAPHDLVRGACTASLDELEHGRASLALVGDGWEVVAFPEAVWPRDRTPTRPRLAADAVIQGCVLERASANVAAELASRDDVLPEVRGLLRQIASDEARHADHGWAVIAWVLGTPDRSRALLEMSRELERVSRSAEPFTGHEDLEPWGIPSTAMWSRALDRAVRETRARLAAVADDGGLERGALEGAAP